MTKIKKIDKSAIDFSKIAGDADQALNGEYAYIDDVHQSYWGDVEELNFEEFDNGAVLIREGDTAMGWTTIEAINAMKGNNSDKSEVEQLDDEISSLEEQYSSMSSDDYSRIFVSQMIAQKKYQRELMLEKEALQKKREEMEKNWDKSDYGQIQTGNELGKMKAEIDRLDEEITKSQKKVDGLAKNIEDFNSGLWSNGATSANEASNSNVSSVNNSTNGQKNKKELEAEKKELERQIKNQKIAISQCTNRIPPSELEKLKQKLAELEKRYSEVEEQLSQISDTVDNSNSSTATSASDTSSSNVSSVNNSTNGQKNKKELEAEKKELERQIKNQKIAISQCTNRIPPSELEKLKQKLAELEKRHSEVEEQLS